MDANRRFVERLLSEIEQQVALLDGTRADLDGVFADPLRANGVYYTLLVAIEGVVAVAHHLIAQVGLANPERNVDSVSILFREGLLPDSPLRERLPAMVRFRNLLVHRYWELDQVRVRAIVESHLDDFRDFAAGVREWLDRGLGS